MQGDEKPEFQLEFTTYHAHLKDKSDQVGAHLRSQEGGCNGTSKQKNYLHFSQGFMTISKIFFANFRIKRAGMCKGRGNVLKKEKRISKYETNSKNEEAQKWDLIFGYLTVTV